ANMNATALKELVTESTGSLQSYGFTLVDNENVEVVNSTESNVTRHVNIVSLGSGAINRTSRSVKVVTSSLILPVGQEANASTASSEVYILNDTLYSGVNGNRTAMKLPMSQGIWTSQDRIGQSATLLNASTIRLIGYEAISGERSYIVEVSPQSGAVSSLIRQQLGSNVSLFHQNLSALFNNTQLRYVVWINATSHLPAMEYEQINMMATPEMLGYPAGAGREIYINSAIAVRFSDLNKTVNIELPEAAKGAVMLPSKSTGTVQSNTTILQNLSSQDPPSDVSSDSSAEEQQSQWLAEAYSFLNGGYYPNFSPTYSFPYMPYSPSYNPYYNYSPSYSPGYNTYYAPYSSPYYGQYMQY
ncbi:MAG TPA: hypothetical protein VN455_01860, partial [Methanotrichaceae archaeon]|nr:hypothetical protein [Methanotrichaceae archaeon]